MMALRKPQTTSDLKPPFRRIGDEGWELALRTLLVEYGVPLAVALSEDEIADRERALGFSLDPEHRLFLSALGPLDFEAQRVLSLSEIETLDNVWFRDALSLRDGQRLASMVAVFDYLGTGEFVAWDRMNGGYWLVGHDPAGIRQQHRSYSDCIREQCVELAAGYFGWPDDEVAQLVDEAREELFPGS